VASGSILLLPHVPTALGRRWLAVGRRWLAVGRRWLAVGPRWLAVGRRWLAVGPRWLAVLFAANVCAGRAALADADRFVRRGVPCRRRKCFPD